jgi:uncharacterized lipoprotein YajG
MKICIPAFALILLAACNAPPAQNNVQEVAANNMAVDEVTEVQDDSASASQSEAESQDPGSNAASGAQPAK